MRGPREHRARHPRTSGLDVETVVGISTDKACKPVNVMGMTKAHPGARLHHRATCTAPNDALHRACATATCWPRAARSSRCSTSRSARGGPVTDHRPTMTRFLLSLEPGGRHRDRRRARERQAGRDLHPARAGGNDDRRRAGADRRARDRRLRVIGIRPGEKVHEILVSEEEAPRTFEHTRRLLRDQAHAARAGAARFDPRPGGTTEYSSQEGLLVAAGGARPAGQERPPDWDLEQARFGL